MNYMNKDEGMEKYKDLLFIFYIKNGIRCCIKPKSKIRNEYDLNSNEFKL